jgi:hypothetical protein
MKCVPPCNSCANLSDCLKCEKGKYLHEDKRCRENCPTKSYLLEDDMTTCYNKSPDGYYLDIINGLYKKCYETCSTCSMNGNRINNNCLGCKNGGYLINSTCYINCPEGYEKRNDSCKSCFEIKKYRFNNACVSSCPFSYFYDENNLCLFCQKIIYNNNCIDNCPSGFINFNKTYCMNISNLKFKYR